MTCRLIETILESERLGEKSRYMQSLVVGTLEIDVDNLEPGKIIRLPHGAALSDIKISYTTPVCAF